jgi:hypothetical protein
VDPSVTPLASHRQPRNTSAVQFFVTGKFAFVPNDKLFPYQAFKESHSITDKRVKDAVQIADWYLQNQQPSKTFKKSSGLKKVRFA